MPVGSFINVIPPGAFIAIHFVLFLVGAYLAYRSFDAALGTFGWAFTLYAAAEIFYMSYHLDLTVILFAHTVAEVLDAVAFVMLFTAGVRELASGRRTRSTSGATPGARVG